MPVSIDNPDPGELRLPTSTGLAPEVPAETVHVQTADNGPSNVVAVVGPDTFTADWHGAPAVQRVPDSGPVTATSSHEVAQQAEAEAETKPAPAEQVQTKPVRVKKPAPPQTK